MSVHRISDAAEVCLQAVAKLEGKKPSEVLSQLIIDYELGLRFSHPTYPMEGVDAKKAPKR